MTTTELWLTSTADAPCPFAGLLGGTKAVHARSLLLVSYGKASKPGSRSWLGGKLSFAAQTML